MGLVSINTDGATGVYNSPPSAFLPDTSPETFTGTRAGYAADGTVTSYPFTRTITTRTYQAPPNDALPTATGVAFDDYVYQTDIPLGITNNSTETSPKPIAQWTIAPRRVWTARCQGGLLCEHRDGIAAVEVWADDGVNQTAHQFITAPTLASRAGDQGAVLEWQFDLDIGNLAAPGAFTLKRIVYPKIGGPASRLLDTEFNQDSPLFKSQTHRRKAAIHYAYLDKVAGNDGTGQIKTTLGGANDPDNKPFLTLKAVMEAARPLMGNNRVEGFELRLRTGTWTHTSAVTFNFYQDATSGEVIITRDPVGTTRQNVIFDMTGIQDLGLVCTAFVDMTFKRSTFAYPNLGRLRMRDMDIDGGAQGIALSNTETYFEGGIVLTGHDGVLQGGPNGPLMVRGVQAGALSGGTEVTTTNRHVAGSKLLGVRLDSNSQPESGGFVTGNVLSSPPTNNSYAAMGGAAGTVVGFAYTNNTGDWRSATANTGVGFTNDNAQANVTHLISRNNTFGGAYFAGRLNIGYDESSGTTRRTHKLWRWENNVEGQRNYKGWRFVYYNQGQTAEAPNRTGSLVIDYGVGFRNNVILYPAADGNHAGVSGLAMTGTFSQQFAGINTIVGTNQNSPLAANFAGYRGATFLGGSSYAAGSGAYSDFKPTTGSALFARVPAGQQSMAVDILGLPRLNNGTGAAGAIERDPPPITGTASIQEANDTFSGQGQLQIKGAGTINEADDTITASGIVAQPPSGVYTGTGPIVASLDRIVEVGNTASGGYAWTAAFDPSDRAPYAIDFTPILRDAEHITEISRIVMSAEGAALGVQVDSGSGRDPIISTDGKLTQVWFKVASAFQGDPAFADAGVAVSLSVLVKTDAAPFEQFERTAVLRVKQQ